MIWKDRKGDIQMFDSILRNGKIVDGSGNSWFYGDVAIKGNCIVKIGMGRIGFPCGKKALENIVQISKMPGLEIVGIMTHFASADEDNSDYTLEQFELFMKQCAELEDMGVHIPVKHVANSAATINYPQMYLDMVRPGIAIYGLYPGDLKNKCAIDLVSASSKLG
jgi:Alanine racemase